MVLSSLKFEKIYFEKSTFSYQDYNYQVLFFPEKNTYSLSIIHHEDEYSKPCEAQNLTKPELESLLKFPAEDCYRLIYNHQEIFK